jgi:3-hydroxy-9,10-secoandrosta-1,3,5(10)-triene-9,17-dione monooxygenase reductase component
MTDSRVPGRHKRPSTSSGSFGGITTGAGSRSAPRLPAVPGMEPSAEAMRAARRRWTTGVGVLSTFERNGDDLQFRGTTVSSFAVLSLEPPLVLIALETGSRMARIVPETGAFAVSILDRAHEFQSDRFSGYGPQPDGLFTGIRHEIAVTGSPILRDALSWFDCRVASVQELGDHLLVIGQVEAIGVGPDTDDPLISYEGAYRRIEGA